MARGINKVILVGNLGQDPELNYTGSGTAVCNMRLATNESYKDKNGELVERTEWHDIVAWARLAEICEQYLQKGSQIYVEGSLQTRSWEDRDGNTRYSTEVKMREMMMLDSNRQGRSGDGRRGQSGGPSSQQRPDRSGDYDQRRQQQPQRSGGGQQAGGGGSQTDDSFDPDDELPF